MSDDLFALARSAMRKAHAPYSKFPVGAAIRTRDGRLFSGCNVEVVSFPEGWCAETTAIAQMVMDGGGRIAEFGSPETKVHLCDEAGVRETVPLGELFPRGFSAENLG